MCWCRPTLTPQTGSVAGVKGEGPIFGKTLRTGDCFDSLGIVRNCSHSHNLAILRHTSCNCSVLWARKKIQIGGGVSVACNWARNDYDCFRVDWVIVLLSLFPFYLYWWGINKRKEYMKNLRARRPASSQCMCECWLILLCVLQSSFVCFHLWVCDFFLQSSSKINHFVFLYNKLLNNVDFYLVIVFWIFVHFLRFVFFVCRK